MRKTKKELHKPGLANWKAPKNSSNDVSNKANAETQFGNDVDVNVLPKATARGLREGGVRVCGDAVLRYFWCGIAVILILKYGIAVFQD